MRSHRIAVALATALIIVGALAGTAHAGGTTTKPYSVVISNADALSTTPATVAGGTTSTIRATYTNRTGQQQLGSSNLTAPAGLRLVSASVAPSGTATISGGTVQLRSLSLAPGASATVTLTVAADCASQTLTWPAPVTKQSNDFNGPPGNDLTFDATRSDLRTVVVGGCILRFLAQPANARAGQSITSAPYDPSGAPMSVEVVNASGARVTTGSFPVTLAIGTNPSLGTLSGTATTSTVAGVASFPGLSIDRPGFGYTLVATSPGATPATSSPFTIDQVAVACAEDVTCSGTLGLTQTGAGSNVQVSAIQGPTTDVDAGFLSMSLGLGGPLDCAGYTELSATADVLNVNYTALDREKTVVATIDKRVMNAISNNGASFLESCFGAPYTFATKPGTPLEVNAAYVPGPYPAPEYKGLLPDCGGSAQLDDPATAGVSGTVIANAGPPCVVKRKKTGSGDGIIESRWPSGRAVGISDPRGRY